MESLRIKGFRSLRDSNEIKLKPITAVIGKNSCGKSSFIRFFPLLKQSLEKEISETLLWYGDYVDFGDFNNIKPNFDETLKTSFEMELNLEDPNVYYISRIKSEKLLVKVTIGIIEKYINAMSIEYLDQKVEFFLDDNGKIDEIIINDNKEYINAEKYEWVRESRLLLPIISCKNIMDEHRYFRFYNDDVYILNELNNIFKEIVPKNTNEDTISKLVDKITFIRSEASVKEYFLENCDLKSISKYFNKSENCQKKLSEINAYIVMATLPKLIYKINQTFLYEADNLHYLKPIRATVNRYYRIQGVNIDQVDSDGSNLAMILYNLNNSDRKAFESWCQNTFNIKFSVSKESGHASLVVKDEFDQTTNLADTGYGYSQILPIIVELWLLLRKKKNLKSEHVTIVIEQPELHLHPAFQMKIVDLFSNIIKEAQENKIDLKIIFETHSETMINRLGYLISENLLSETDVNVLAFEKNNRETNITSMNFDKSGLIKNWPVGFFSAEE